VDDGSAERFLRRKRSGRYLYVKYTPIAVNNVPRTPETTPIIVVMSSPPELLLEEEVAEAVEGSVGEGLAGEGEAGEVAVVAPGSGIDGRVDAVTNVVAEPAKATVVGVNERGGRVMLY
jgi:hypothetical protein